MNNNLKENIKKIRKENNLSQEELAEQLGVSRQAISKWESGAAYPEMDKIIFLCEKFHLNIDDLLHKDIKEIKGEEETKNNINKYIDDFFKFLTDSITLITRMKWKSKIKWFFEQCIIAFILLLVNVILFSLLSAIVGSLPIRLLSDDIYFAILGVVQAVYVFVAFILSVIILVKIFKTRYLDYYQETTERVKKEKQESTEDVEKSSRIETKEEEKIIIRDPKHSEYRFLNGCFKLFILGVKFMTLWIELFLCIGLFFLFLGVVTSFLISKTGLFFIGTLLLFLSLGVMDMVVILLLFNFIFNRKSNKKVMIWTFILSIVFSGISCGLMTIGGLKFDVVEYKSKKINTDIIELNMDEKYYFTNDEIEYVEEDIPNIKIIYQIDENYEAMHSIYPSGNIHVWTECTNPMKLAREILKEINEKHLPNENNTFEKIEIHASKENIEKLKANEQKFYDERKSYDSYIEELEDEIEEKEETIRELQDKIYSLEEEQGE